MLLHYENLVTYRACIRAELVPPTDHVQLGLAYERRHPEAAILMDLATPEGARRTLGVDAYPLGLIAEPSWLDRNRDTARRIARAYKAYHRWIMEHTPEDIREATPVEHLRVKSRLTLITGR